MGPLFFPESVSDPEDVVKHATRLGDDVLCITDHNTMKGAFKAREAARKYEDLDLVMGEEISTSEGEIIGLWLNEEIPKGMTAEETVDAIRAQGGVVVAPHPFSLHVPSLQDRIFNLDIDAIETINAGHIDSYSNSQAQRVANTHGRWATLGASDAHSMPTMGHAWTEYRGLGEEDLRRSIMRRECYARGYSVPIDKAIDWSIGVVMQADLQIIRSMLGLIRSYDADDPVQCKIQQLPTHKKILGLVGSFFYLLPPMPHVASILSGRWLSKKVRQISATPAAIDKNSMDVKSSESPLDDL